MFAPESHHAQLSLFWTLATNCRSGPPTNLYTQTRADQIRWLDGELSKESTFFTCRALRRLLLGYKVLEQSPDSKTYNLDPGLIILTVERGPGLIGVRSLEATDVTLCSRPFEASLARYITAAHFPATVEHKTMLRFIFRYLTYLQFERCVEQFRSILPKGLRNTLTKNYFTLLNHFRHNVSLTLQPTICPHHRDRIHLFCLGSLMLSCPNNTILRELNQSAFRATIAHHKLVSRLWNLNSYTPLATTNQSLQKYAAAWTSHLPRGNIVCHKRYDPTVNNLIILLKRVGESEDWKEDAVFSFPDTSEGHCTRVLFALALAPSIAPLCAKDTAMWNSGGDIQSAVSGQDKVIQSSLHFSGKVTGQTVPNASSALLNDPSRHLVSMLRRIEAAPKDPPMLHTRIIQTSVPTCTIISDPRHIQEHFQVSRCVPISHNFRLAVFNTNRVINTKIICDIRGFSKHICNLPRLVSNFVARKYVVKEPSFTVSLFYTGGESNCVAINMNINGTYLAFLQAIASLRCFLPISGIFPASISNWNSTLDLHGLENQSLVRENRDGVFWTTNFPSVISCNDGLNVSWFKAATATISRVCGRTLEDHLIREVTPIVTHKNAKISVIKNRLFTLLESRNGCQIQVPHKRLLECLLECASLLRLDPKSFYRLPREGVFDFFKKDRRTLPRADTSVHSLATRHSSNVTKLIIGDRKVRLDSLGRNANFLTRFKHKLTGDIGHLHTVLLQNALRRLSIGSTHLKHELKDILRRVQRPRSNRRNVKVQGAGSTLPPRGGSPSRGTSDIPHN
ncbi:ORF16 [callitrichine gammaherpesvirus 3]|uniref:ORF16 n=1 Tax=callitrichine gammaherpesvirus 3 TaxID=106331 RepID=Q993J4_9GAMA|nr:ORF16 [callitrichine gammaherpesvirus 3]AAK38224.1 ORF16 [callitrichine gammaherpesvirus 3]